MRIRLVVVGVLASCSLLRAEKTLRQVHWAQVERDGLLLGGEVMPAGNGDTFDQLKIENKGDTSLTVHVLTIADPGVTTSTYALTGQVRYEDVVGDAYLEMQNQFGSDGAFYSRTLGRHQMTAKLSGTSAWRPFSLPFFVNADRPGRPTRIDLNVVLPGCGAVYLGSVRLVEYQAGEDPLAIPGQWWSGRTAGWIGGIGGSVVGLVGGLIGTLASFGRARRITLGMTTAFIMFGACAVAAGVVAAATGQPYAVYYPLLLGGGICAVVLGCIRPQLRRRYEEVELRRMQAVDAA